MRSIILAGGGLKIAYQAGCLQVLRDEAGLEFDHVDAASGGCFNAALWANGYSGTEMADLWRQMEPADFFALNMRGLRKLLWTQSIGTSAGIRNVIRNDWRLDFERIRSCRRPQFTFNVHNFTRKTLLTLDQAQMTEDYLLACVALVMWFPPVVIDGDIYFDAVWCRDANVAEAVRRGADEIWAIWTVSNLADYRDGFLAQYFHIIEGGATTKFFEEWSEIAAVNEAIANHGPDGSRPDQDLRLARGSSSALPPPGRKRIEQHLILQEVPVQYLVCLSHDRIANAVEMGVRDARSYCKQNGLVTTSQPVRSRRAMRGLSFTETMAGLLRTDESATAPVPLNFQLTVSTPDLDVLLTSPDHVADGSGFVQCTAFSDRPMPITAGSCSLFEIDRGADGLNQPWRKRFVYELEFVAPSGERYSLHGVKLLPGGKPDPWRDTTTLFATIHALLPNGMRSERGSATLRMSLFAFVRELTTFRIRGAQGPGDVFGSLVRFFRFFVGQMSDVYRRQIVDYAPY